MLEHFQGDDCVIIFLTGNSMLLCILPSLYEKQSQPINSHLRELAALMSDLEQSEQNHLLRLLLIIAKKKQPEVTLTDSSDMESMVFFPAMDIEMCVAVKSSGFCNFDKVAVKTIRFLIG